MNCKTRLQRRMGFLIPPHKEFVRSKNIIANIFRVQANNSVMSEYFCIGFIDFMLAGKELTDFMSMFSPYGFEKTDNIILSLFKDERN